MYKRQEENQEQILEKLDEINNSQTSLPQDEMSAQQSYDSAVLGGKLAGDIYGYTLDALQDTVDEARTAVNEAQELLEDFEAFVGTDGIVYADGTGLVTEIAYEAGDKLMNTGVMLSYVTRDAYTITIDAVSYTHLDVYKRQILGRLQHKGSARGDSPH